MGNIFVRRISLPGKVKGMVTLNKDGDYIIFVNDTLADDIAIATADHEIRHLFHNHFQSDKPVIFNELEAR